MKCLFCLLTLIMISTLVSCDDPPKKQKTMSDNQTNLQTLLDQKKSDFNLKASEEKKAIYKKGLDAVLASNILEKALQVGDSAPNFTLNNAIGKEVSLYDQLNKGPVVLIWYRGGWCPYCNITLNYLQQKLPKFTEAGASLVALTPEIPDKALSTVEKHHLTFEVLSDVGNEIAKEYGVVFELIPEVADIYQKVFDLHGYNGDETNELPLAATYVVGTDRTIAYAFLDIDYRKRAEPIEIIAALDKLKK